MIRIVYGFQTEGEKFSKETIEENGIGFSGCDAMILSSFAQQLLDKNYLSQKQMEITRRKMLKYCGQILKYMEEN